MLFSFNDFLCALFSSPISRYFILSSPSTSSLLAMYLCPPMFLSNGLLSCLDIACDPVLFCLILFYPIFPRLSYSITNCATTFLRDDPQLYRAPLTPDVLSTHERIEELLESHLLDVESLEAKLSYLLKTLQNAEASVCTSTYAAHSIIF